MFSRAVSLKQQFRFWLGGLGAALVFGGGFQQELVLFAGEAVNAIFGDLVQEIVHSKAASTSLAENYVGLPY